MEQRTVGILGGLGPLATVEFMRMVLRRTPVSTDRDHLHMIVDCNPHVPDINRAAMTGGREPVADLVSGVRRLEQAGADLVVMVCNAAHVFELELRAALGVPFISMITATIEAITTTAPSVRRVGVLGTNGCLATGIYQNELARHGLESVELGGADLADFMRSIARIKAGHLDDDSRDGMLRAAATLSAAGSEVLVLACTEIGLVLSQDDCIQPLFDPSDCLAAATVRAALPPTA